MLTDLMTDEEKEEEIETPQLDAVHKIRNKFQGLSITVSRGPQSKQLTEAQKAEAVKESGASTESITMGKRLFDVRVVRRVPELKKVNEVISEINRLSVDRSFTLPYPEPGVRLVRKGDGNLDKMSEFVEKFEKLRTDLDNATLALRDVWDRVKEVASQELVKLYDPADYAFDPHTTITATYKFVEVGVPSYLKHNKELYAQEEARVKEELELVKAIKEGQMAESMFEVVDRIVERLEPRKLLDETHEVYEVVEDTDNKKFIVRYQPSGTSKKDQRKTLELSASEHSHRVTVDRKPKTFVNASVTQLFEGLEHAQEMLEELSIGDGKVAEAFDKIRNVVQGQDNKSLAGALRNSDAYRERVRESLGKVTEFMMESVIDKPRRALMRKKQRQQRKQD